MPGPKDYTRSGFYITSLVIILLLCVSFIPSFRVGNVVVKRANILSDVVTFQDERLVPVSDMDLLDTSFLDDFKPVPVQEVVDATGVTGPEEFRARTEPMRRGCRSPVWRGPVSFQ